jgi:carotenoid cleavage dioxygenase-like enzyme
MASRQDEAPFGFDHGPYLTGAYAPVFDEQVLQDLPIEGCLPTDLTGVYLRNGPDQRFEPKSIHHPFDGDGMLFNAHFQEGKVTIRNKWVRTSGWLKESETDQSEYWGIMSSYKESPERPMKDTANTDVIGHAGVAVASWYLAGEPYLLDPITLDTLGPAPYTAAPGYGFSAHPKVDDVTGELMFFDYFHQAPHMSYGVVGADRKLKHHVEIELPGSRLPHDMAITEHYSILHDLPVWHCEEAYAAGRHKIVFDANTPARFGVIPRFGGGDTIRWFEFSSCFLYHSVNAWEEGNEVVMVACRFMPALDAKGEIDEARTAKNIAELKMDARLWEYRMNIVTGEATERCLNPDLNVEFPTFDSGKTGRFTQWAYLVDHNPETLHWTGIRKLSTVTGECVGAWSDDSENAWYSEPWFAAADNQRCEDHGYVITFVWNNRTKEQQLQVFDAQDISQGPIARVHMPLRVPQGFHACWMSASQLAAA